VLIAHVYEEGHARDLYILHVPTLGHTYTHMLGTHACKFSSVDDAPVAFIQQNPRPGGGVQISTPIAFSVRGLTYGSFALFWFV
jgi:hypothetical protein